MQQRVCEITGGEFVLTEEERAAYERFDVPLPNASPEERCRRQLAFRNEEQFFWRKCDASGKKIYSAFSPHSPFPVVGPDYWWSDSWDALTFGQELNSKRPFFEQLLDLWWKVPRPAYTAHNVVRSAAVHNAWNVDASFVVFNAHGVSKCFNSVGIWGSRLLADCYFVSSSEL